LPVYYNLGDEPIGADLVRSAQNAEAYRKAFPAAPPWFTAASSFQGDNADDPHFRLSKAVHVANWNSHDEASVNLLAADGRRVGLLQRRQPLDVRHVFVQGSPSVRHEVPALLALEHRGGRPVLRARLPRGRLRLVQQFPPRRLDPVGPLRAVARGLDDYRRLLTLTRLVNESPGHPRGRGRTATDRRSHDSCRHFSSARRDHAALFPATDWTDFRHKIDDAIESTCYAERDMKPTP
jgi:hypothetical protein